jgi:AraC family transcriptional regulator of adaptative response/methylated-DNA-[protein]-cysteine methyltransferase
VQSDYQRVEAAINYIQKHVRTQPTLEEVASHVGLSSFHFQRLFRRWAGTSPKRFLEFLTVEHAKRCLDHAETLLQTSLEVGLSGPARLHDQFVATEASTPGEYKSRGRGVEIAYGVHEGPFGDLFIAQTRRGVCRLALSGQDGWDSELDGLRNIWTNARIYEDKNETALTVSRIFTPTAETNWPIWLFVRGTNFQINVWRALMRIPEGCLISYRQLAAFSGYPSATRAVANALAVNPIAYLIPCHRVIRNSGETGDYRWGSTRKRVILAWESARVSVGASEPEPR